MAIATTIPRSEILKLYKGCLTYVNTLKYSDKDYLRQRIRCEFSRDIARERVEFNFKKGQEFLARDRLA